MGWADCELVTDPLSLSSSRDSCPVPVVVMLQRLEEETHTNKYIVTEKLPKEIAQRKKIVVNLQKVVAEPAMGQSDLDRLHEQVQLKPFSLMSLERVIKGRRLKIFHDLHYFVPLQISDLNEEIKQLVEKKLRTEDPTDNKSALFKQQVSL